MFIVLGDNCRLASSDGALRSLGAGRPWAGVMTELAGADWLVGAVCGLCLFACVLFPPFRFGAIRNEIFVRSIAFYDAATDQIEAGLPPPDFFQVLTVPPRSIR